MTDILLTFNSRKEDFNMSFIDTIIGKKFGRLTVQKIVPGIGRRMAECVCDCSAIIAVDPRNLKSGNTRSCGCIHKEQLRNRQKANLVGQRFGRLQVVSEGPDIPLGKRQKPNIGWYCKCDCGETRHLTSNALLSGNTRSCGCYNRDRITEVRQSEASYTTLYNKWNLRAVERSIPWKISALQAETLFKQDCHYCGAAPLPGRSSPLPNNGLDRINNESGYEPGNVVACCKQCNFAKHTMSYDSFMDLINRIYTNRAQFKTVLNF